MSGNYFNMDMNREAIIVVSLILPENIDPGQDCNNSMLTRPDEELIPQGSALFSGSNSERRNAALDTSTAGEVLSGGVLEDEIKVALPSSLPTLDKVPEGAPLLPLSGLPEGWSMDQWVAYGQM